MNTLKEKIYVIGHTNPDLDSIVSSIAYARYKHSQGAFNYIPIRCDKINPLTEWVLKEYNIPLPQYIPDISGMNIVLVDHTFPESRAKGWENANILEVIDHHDVKLEDILPKHITIRPCGSTATLISEKFFNSNIQIPKDIAYILLTAILDDTLGLKSPTTIQIDIEMVKELNEICRVGDIQEYSKKVFRKKDIWNTLNVKQIIVMDITEVEIGKRKVAISQVETLNNELLKQDKIVDELKKMNSTNPLNLRLVMLTDLNKKECILLVVGDDIPLLEEVLKTKIINNRVLLPNVVSRKKQVLPILEEMYKGI